MFYAIKGYDSMYMGLHGMNDWVVEWCDDMNEAEEVGRELSENVINSYSEITEALYQEMADIAGIDYENDLMPILESGKLFLSDFEGAYDEALDNFIAYDIVALNIKNLDDIPGDWDWDEIIETFQAD